jgi:hypothetical protein
LQVAFNASSATVRTLSEENEVETKIFPKAGSEDAWFDFKGCDRFEVEEQSFLLPNDEIITVLKLLTRRSLERREADLDRS